MKNYYCWVCFDGFRVWGGGKVGTKFGKAKEQKRRLAVADEENSIFEEIIQFVDDFNFF